MFLGPERQRTVDDRSPSGHHELPRRPSQQGPHTQFELLNGKRLDEIVICSRIEALALVTEKISGRQNKDRHCTRLPNGLERLLAVHFRHHEVENHQIRFHRRKPEDIDSLSSVLRLTYVKAGVFERFNYKPSDAGFVVGNKNKRFVGHDSMLLGSGR